MWRKDEPGRWSQLFADLDAQAEAVLRAEEYGDVAERTRIEVGKLTLADRLRPAVGRELAVRCVGAGPLLGRLDGVGADWLELTESTAAESVVPLAAVIAVCGLGRWSTVADGVVDRRLGLRSVLRRLSRNRAVMRLVLTDGGTLTGTIDRVGADFLELAEHAQTAPRRAGAVLRVWTLPLASLAVVRRPPP